LNGEDEILGAELDAADHRLDLIERGNDTTGRSLMRPSA
jgi:hypothetical protein